MIDSDALMVPPEEAARMLRLGRTKVFELIREGAIETVLVGRARRVPVDSLREYVARLRSGQQ